MHNSDTIDQSTGDMCKPEVITFYNLIKGVQHRLYIKTLSLDLKKPHLVTRVSIPTHPGELECIIKHVAGLHVVNNLSPPVQQFCGICPRYKNMRTKKICAKCHVPICNEHTKFVCRRYADGEKCDDE
ncbi:hypothetical protein PR048_021672 [Dryococelus australis]|uniref:PiggyBac transposable element-derived protein 4 C-terminal zinc-ribbon domain-containing protein n=1 Tax=Dryococelus australis TaxID=614101 RepID=A0ABQ9GYX0_9NEOP|nr:hypothetical protein PR048_021672 [Dryococelus australis]